MTIKVIDFGTAETFKSRAKLREFVGTSYYMAPEVIAEKYTEKCDVWSCGVILYILLSGYPPFGGRDDRAILRSIVRGKYDFDGMFFIKHLDDLWRYISDSSKKMINSMLISPEAIRFSADEALNHEWIKTHSKVKENPSILKNVLSNLQKFQVNM